MNPKLYGIALWHQRHENFTIHSVFDPTGDDKQESLEALDASIVSSIGCLGKCSNLCSADNWNFEYDIDTRELTFESALSPNDELHAKIRTHCVMIAQQFCGNGSRN